MDVTTRSGKIITGLPMTMFIDNKVETVIVEDEKFSQSKNLVMDENALKNSLVDEYEVEERKKSTSRFQKY